MATRYRTSVVGIVDILGVSARLSDPDAAKRYAEAVAAILRPMIADKHEYCLVLPHVDDARKIEIFLSPTFTADSKISFISDSIVISAPIDVPGDRDGKCLAILACLETIKALQRSLLMLGLRSRGGVAIGGLVHSGELLVGDGLLRAYEIERRQSVFPRTVVDSTLIQYLIDTAWEHCPVFLNRVAHVLRQDEDGLFFVDYLSFSPMEGYCGLEAQFRAILDRLQVDLVAQKDRPWIAKVEWLFRYASNALDECRTPEIAPFVHAGEEFAYLFPRTNETMLLYLESEIELVKTLRSYQPEGLESADHSRTSWPLGWRTIRGSEQKDRFNAELDREISVGHVLDGLRANVLGRFHYSDEFLYQIDDGRIAQVHLTWNSETNPQWPHTTIHPSFFDWEAKWNAEVDEIRRFRREA